LAQWRIVYCIFEGENFDPLLRWSRFGVWCDLVQPPKDFQPMTIRIQKFNRDLGTGTATTFKLDLYVVLY
jgi:hypothetical protein